jgi:hypothetical protein
MGTGGNPTVRRDVSENNSSRRSLSIERFPDASPVEFGAEAWTGQEDTLCRFLWRYYSQ